MLSSYGYFCTITLTQHRWFLCQQLKKHTLLSQHFKVSPMTPPRNTQWITWPKMEPFWFVLAVALAASSLGPKGFFALIFALLAFIIGGLLVLFGVCFARSNYSFLNLIKNWSKQSWNWFRGPYMSSEKLKRNEADVQDLGIMWDSASLTGKLEPNIT